MDKNDLCTILEMLEVCGMKYACEFVLANSDSYSLEKVERYKEYIKVIERLKEVANNED